MHYNLISVVYKILIKLKDKFLLSSNATITKVRATSSLYMFLCGILWEDYIECIGKTIFLFIKIYHEDFKLEC